MKISHGALSEHIEGEFSPSPKQVQDLLTQMGAGIEGIEQVDGEPVYEIEITANRPDWLSAAGLTREMLAAVRDNVQMVMKAIDHDYSGLPQRSVDSKTVRPEDCPRYLGRTMTGVTVGESPAWLKQYLGKNGMNSINNIVDITNYVMHQTGQPMHAFDAETIQGNIAVRNAQAGENATLLNGKNVYVPEGAIVISDESDAILAIAGIMGGQDSEVRDVTKAIVLESAYFDPVAVRRASKSMNLMTEASYRFERGGDPEIVQYALDRASDLIAMYCGGTPTENHVHDVYRHNSRELSLRISRVGKVLGVYIEEDFVLSSLQRLGFSVKNAVHDVVSVTVPSWRMHDVKFEDCLVEEVAKVYGYENIPNTMPKIDMESRPRSSELLTRDALESVLVSRGFHQVMNFSFAGTKDVEQFAPPADSNLRHYPIVMNPLSTEASIMRPSMVPGLLSTYLHNFDRGERSIRLFETGHIFHQKSSNALPYENVALAGLLSGNVKELSWGDQQKPADFHDAKSVVYSMLQEIGIDLDTVSITPGNNSFLQEGSGADLSIDGVVIGYVGELKNNVVKPHKQRRPIIVFELDMDALSQISKTHPEPIEHISKFPAIERDFAFVCEEAFPTATIEDAFHRLGRGLVRSVKLYDVYKGKSLPTGQHSVAFRVRFASNYTSLTHECVSEIADEVVADLKEGHIIGLRK